LVVHRDPSTVRGVVEAREVESLIASANGASLGVHVEYRPVSDDPVKACVDVARTESVGVIAAPMGTRRAFRPYAGIPRHLSMFGKAGVPVLLTRGAPGFDEIIAPSRRTLSGDAAARAAIDLAKRSGAKVIGVAVANPLYMGRDDLMEKKHATAWLRQEASVQDVDVERHVVRGNPVKVLASVMAPERLFVVSMPALPIGRVNPGIAVWAVARGRGSALFVPAAK
jgi:hypothetical protein